MSDLPATLTAGQFSACRVVQSGAGLVECTENSVEENNPRMLEMAPWYVRGGMPVFPCKPRLKRPLTHQGFKVATRGRFERRVGGNHYEGGLPDQGRHCQLHGPHIAWSSLDKASNGRSDSGDLS